ncbi:MAG: hypothetical protein RLZZ324_80 [Candidatus Parcubacteria bacterium]
MDVVAVLKHIALIVFYAYCVMLVSAALYGWVSGLRTERARQKRAAMRLIPPYEHVLAAAPAKAPPPALLEFEGWEREAGGIFRRLKQAMEAHADLAQEDFQQAHARLLELTHRHQVAPLLFGSSWDELERMTGALRHALERIGPVSIGHAHGIHARRQRISLPTLTVVGAPEIERLPNPHAMPVPRRQSSGSFAAVNARSN